MKRLQKISGLITVISLFLGVIWLGPAFAAAPVFTSLGQITAEGLQIPGAVDVDEAGNLYVADARGGKVHKFDRYNRFVQSFDVDASGAGLAVKPGTSGAPGEYGVPSGILYVAQNQAVVIFDAEAGAVVGEFSGVDDPGFAGVGEIDIDRDGNVFVVDAGSMTIKAYTAAGEYRGSFGGPGSEAGQFMQIGGMAINNANQIVVADSSLANGKVQIFDINYPDLTVNAPTVYSKSSVANFGSPAMHSPRGMTFDADGRGYLLDFMSSEVRVIDAGFAYLGKYSSVGYGAGQLINVYDAIYEEVSDRLYVGCDTGEVEILGVDGGLNPVRVNSAPSVPTLVSPIAGSEVASKTPTLIIDNSIDEEGDAVTYSVIVSQGEATVYQADVVAAQGEKTSIAVDVELTENAAYSWTAQASDGEKSSAVSIAADFVVNATEEAPSVPELIAPADGEVVSGLDALSWGSSVDPDPNDDSITYAVEVAADSLFEQVVASAALAETAMVIGDFASYGDLVDGGVYFWRVAAQDDGQTASAPSSAGQFVYDTTVLTVKANMPDAEVSFHGNHAYSGQSVGIAPLEKRDVAPGKISIVVERAGFEKFVTQVELTEGENRDVYAELLPAMKVEKLSVNRNGINGRSNLTVGSAAPFLVDFDNDGDLDLLVGDATGQVSLFANMEVSGRTRLYFDPAISVLDNLPGAVPFVADWNNDGRKDMIVGQANGFVTLFINNGLEGAPAFAAGVDVYAGSSALHVGNNAAPAVVDYNGDGAKDLIVGNAAGQVAVYLNQGTDAEPALSGAAQILDVPGSVPFPVDWNEDGQKDLLMSGDGAVTLYIKAGDTYQVGPQFSAKGANYVSAFPIDIDGTGKQLLVGQEDGQVVYLVGKDNVPTDSFHAALQDKATELVDLVAIDAPEFNDDAGAIAVLVAAGDYDVAMDSVKLLASQLPVGDARTSASELRDLL